jgi:hypothetical protein
VKEMLADMLGMDFDDEGFDARFTSHMKAVQHHVEEEEGPGGNMEIARQKISTKKLNDLTKDSRSIKRDVEGEMAA